MRSLREKLMAVASKPPAAPALKRETPEEPFYVCESSVPLCELRGIEQVTLEEICACDPYFTGSAWKLEKLLFLDTETTGLSGGAGTVAFQIGAGYIRGNDMIIRQYVMRDYSEEAAMLRDLSQLLQQFETIVTFNGKTFDLPLLESRMIMHRIRLPLTSLPHFDLLHACRRVYKLRLKRCNLASLEEALLGEKREDDLPGSQVPQRYFDYLKTKEFALLKDILRHNRQDVQSLASLTGHICAAFRCPEALEHPEDLFGVGRTFERGGRVLQARRCYRILGHSSLSSKAHMRLASGYKHDRAWDEALETWKTMIARGEGRSWPYIEAAKYYEHAAMDIPRALSYAKAALSCELNTSLLKGCNEDVIAGLHRRIERLNKKQSSAMSRS